MWLKRRDRFVLNPQETRLKKWLPVLSEERDFSFREDIEVEWAHYWPRKSIVNTKVIYFTRDPRDALYSRYRRESPDATFEEFLDFPDSFTLLDKIDTWCLFHEAWLQWSALSLYRFEDYKMNAPATLRAVLKDIGLVFPDNAIDEATRRSSFDRAAAAEQRYRQLNPQDTEIINRASQVGSWKDPSLVKPIAKITERCRGIMVPLGYVSESAGSKLPSYLPHSKLLPIYAELKVAPAFWERENDGCEEKRLAEIVALAMRLTPTLMDKHRLERYERLALLDSLDDFMRRLARAQRSKLTEIWSELAGLPRSLKRAHRFLLKCRFRTRYGIKILVRTLMATKTRYRKRSDIDTGIRIEG